MDSKHQLPQVSNKYNANKNEHIGDNKMLYQFDFKH